MTVTALIAEARGCRIDKSRCPGHGRPCGPSIPEAWWRIWKSGRRGVGPGFRYFSVLTIPMALVMRTKQSFSSP
jgi:hypothetical protein